MVNVIKERIRTCILVAMIMISTVWMEPDSIGRTKVC